MFLLDIDTQKYAISPAPMLDDKGKSKGVAAVLSEFFGTYFFVFMFMIAMDQKSQFSKDKVINCLVIASSYVSARLIAGGQLITGTHFNNGATLFKKSGPLLNPAIAFGMMIEGGWRFWF